MQSIVHSSREGPSRWERLALASGIAFAALQLIVMVIFAGFILPKLGEIDAPAAIRASAYAEHGDLLRLGNYLLTLPAAFFLLFLGGFGAVLHRAEGGSGTFAMASVLAGGAMAKLWPLAGIISDIGIDIAGSGGDAATVASLDAIAPYSLALSAIPRTALLVASSAVLLPSRVVPRWIGWSGFGLTIVSLCGSATLVAKELFPLLALSTLLFEGWIIGVCVVLLGSKRTSYAVLNRSNTVLE